MVEANSTVDCEFQDRSCTLSFSAGSTIDVELEDKISREKWMSSFEPSYIESLTRRTGNFKTFYTFSLMLKALFSNTSTSMSMQLLSQKDLENMNRGKAQFRNLNQKPENDKNSEKKIYFIVIYKGEFDKSFYPLPLDYQGLPNIQVLYESMEKLQRENWHLKQKLRANGNTLSLKPSYRCLQAVQSLANQSDQLIRNLDNTVVELIDIISEIAEKKKAEIRQEEKTLVHEKMFQRRDRSPASYRSNGSRNKSLYTSKH